MPWPSRRRAPSPSSWSSSRPSWPRPSRPACASRPSASAPGPGCSGQIQVITDVLGLGDFVPRHASPYADLRGIIADATARYAADVEAGAFPGEAQTVRMDDAVLDEVLGRGRSRPAGRGIDAGGRHPARPRPLIPSPATRPSPHDRRRPDPGRPACRAGRRAATGRAGADHGLAARRPHLAHRAGPGRERHGRRLDLRQPAPVRRDDRLHGLSPQRGPRPGVCEAAGVDLVFAPDGRRGLPAGLRHGRDRRRHRRAAGGRRPARPLRGRGHGRGHPVRPGRRRAGLLRGQGRPAGPGHPADGHSTSPCRPRSSPCPPCASRTGWPCRRATPGCRRRRGPRRRSSIARWTPPASATPPANAPPRRCARRCARRWPASRWPTLDYVSVADDATLAELDVVDRPALLSIAASFEGVRLIDNEPLP